MRLSELTIALPCTQRSPASTTRKSDESIMMGSFAIAGSLATRFRKCVIASTAFSIASSMFTSRMFAPPSTWLLATSSASSNEPDRMSRANFAEPVTFVRSPTITKPVSSRNSSSSSPV